MSDEPNLLLRWRLAGALGDVIYSRRVNAVMAVLSESKDLVGEWLWPGEAPKIVVKESDDG